MSRENDPSPEQRSPRWERLFSNLWSVTVVHPFYYGRTLMQLGYEPWPPEAGRSILGAPILRLPNLFQYVGHIESTQGFFGCFHGLTPNLLEAIISSYVLERMNAKLGPLPTLNNKPEDEITHEDLDTHFRALLKRDLQVHLCGIVLTHPFRVVVLRMMSQFMSTDKEFSGMFATIASICRNDGIFGFYGGLVPRLIYELTSIIITRYATLLLRKYVITHDNFLLSVSSFCVACIVENLFYPFRLVSTCMSVNSKGLSAAQYPTLPFYTSSMDCWSDLSARGELHRGESVIYRTLNDDQLRARKKGKLAQLFGK